MAFLRLILVALALFAVSFNRAAATDVNYNGHYELVDTKAKRDFTLDVKQTGSRAEITFAAAMEDGSGAAPDGTGKGRVEDGVLSFKFTDSFDNGGTCTLEPAKGAYLLTFTIIKVTDPRPFHFYGTVTLKKTSEQPDWDDSATQNPKSEAPANLPK